MLQNLSTIIVSDDDIKLSSEFSITAINTAIESNQSLLHDIGRLRYQVWQQQGMDMSNATNHCIIDNIDQNALIWAIYHHQQLIATARLNVYDDLTQSPTAYMHQAFTPQFPLPAATFTRLVVAKPYQGMKIGKLLDQIRLNQAKALGVKSVLLLCPPKRAESLQKIGGVCLGKAKPSKLWPNAHWMLVKFEYQ